MNKQNEYFMVSKVFNRANKLWGMNDLKTVVLNFIKKYSQLFTGLMLGFVIFLLFSLTAINILLFLMLGTFLETSLIYFMVSPNKLKQSILPQTTKDPQTGQSRGRPKGSKNKPKVQTP